MKDIKSLWRAFIRLFGLTGRGGNLVWNEVELASLDGISNQYSRFEEYGKKTGQKVHLDPDTYEISLTKNLSSEELVKVITSPR